jgi:hypothetical protein
LRLVLPVDDDGVLVALVTFALGDDDALVFGLDEDVDEGLDEDVDEGLDEAVDEGLDEAVPEADEEAAATAVCVAAGLLVLAQGCGLAGTGPLVVVGLGLLLGLLVADGVLVVVEVGLGLLGVLVADGVPVVVEVGLGLLLAPALELAVLSLLLLPPDDVAGAVVVWVALLGELLVVRAADECAEADVQAVVGAGTPVTLLALGVSTGALLAPSVLPGGFPEPPVKA